ncbi:hypothetical protein Tco_1485371 [Tanacetum coccineum]
MMQKQVLVGLKYTRELEHHECISVAEYKRCILELTTIELAKECKRFSGYFAGFRPKMSRKKGENKRKKRPSNVYGGRKAVRVKIATEVRNEVIQFSYNRSASAAAARSAWERLRPLAADSVATIPEPETIKVQLVVVEVATSDRVGNSFSSFSGFAGLKDGKATEDLIKIGNYKSDDQSALNSFSVLIL